MHLEEFIQKRLKGINLIHDFSLGAMLCYHELEDKLNKSKAEISENGNIITFEKKGGKVLFAYEDVDVKTLTEGSKLNTRYPINGAKKFKEIVYQLKDLRKDYDSYSRPINIFEKRKEITLEDLAGQPGLNELHDSWRDYKLSLPKIHRISFPTARYKRTIQNISIPTFQKVVYVNGKLYGFIVFTVENNVAFLLSFITLYWQRTEFNLPSGFNQYLLSYCLIQLEKQGINFCNAGFASTKGVKQFKNFTQNTVDIFRYEYHV